jgi:hypothetical protein
MLVFRWFRFFRFSVFVFVFVVGFRVRDGDGGAGGAGAGIVSPSVSLFSSLFPLPSQCPLSLPLTQSAVATSQIRRVAPRRCVSPSRPLPRIASCRVVSYRGIDP